MLGDDAVEDGQEAYEFNWVGKQAARAEVLRPINKTLRPVKEDSVDWDNTQNLYIEGDNLEVLKLLQKSYLGKVKMIYIDPPYNTGKTSFITMTLPVRRLRKTCLLEMWMNWVIALSRIRILMVDTIRIGAR